MNASSRNKGARGEREIVALFQDSGWVAHRVGEFKPDDVKVSFNDYDLTVEVKRRKNGFSGLYRFLEHGDMVCHRADRREWLVTMPLKLFLEMVGRWRAIL